MIKSKHIFNVCRVNLVMFGKYLICISILSLLLFSMSFAATYHVRTDGHDTASGENDTTDGATGALLTINHCLSAHATAAGDICNVHSGTYNEAVTAANSGTAGNLITVQADGGDVVSVRMVRITKPSYVLNNYVKIKGLTITGPGGNDGAGIYVNGGNNVISNNTVLGSGRTDNNTYAIQVYGGSNNTIDGNTIDGESTSVQSFYIVFSVGSTGNVFTNNIVKNLYNNERVWDCGGTGQSSDNTIVRGNEVFSMTWDGTDVVHPDIFQVVPHGGTNTAHGWLIENNYFHDLNSQIGFNEVPTDSQNWIIRNNVFANITHRASLSSTGTKWYNNTFFQVNTSTNGVADMGLTGVEFKNNIVIGWNASPSDTLMTVVGVNPAMSNNYWSSPMGNGYAARSSARLTTLGDTNYINGGDPRFVAAYSNCTTNICDFHLKPNSPLINKGADLSGSWSNATDHSGTPRRQGTKWDIGAYETNKIRPLPPTNVRINNN